MPCPGPVIRSVRGIALIIVAMVGALTVPNLTGHRISGLGTAVAIPPPPRVGDCLLRNDPVTLLPEVGADEATPRLPCSSPHDGEIILLATTLHEFPMIKQGGTRFPDPALCAEAAYPYLGVHRMTEGGVRSALLGPWWPASIGRFGFLSPSPLQRRAGQTWLACVLSSPQGVVTGSAAAVLHDRASRNPVAFCLPGTNVLLDVSISCGRPHAMEVLGWRVADESVGGQRPLDTSCAELAVRMTGMRDPTARGQLSVAAVVGHYDTNGILQAGYGPGPHSELNCAACTISAAGTRMLDGTLTGLGDAPLPWA
jgi:hypothetical protein